MAAAKVSTTDASEWKLHHLKWICDHFIPDFRALTSVKLHKNLLGVQFVHIQYLILLLGKWWW